MERKHGTVSLTEWDLEATDKLQALLSTAVREAAAEALRLALDDDGTYAFMPAIWGDTDGCGGPRCDDPLTVYFSVAATDGVEGPIWASSLTKMLEDQIAICAEDGSWADGFARIRDALRELADRIDHALPSNVRAKPETPHDQA